MGKSILEIKRKVIFILKSHDVKKAAVFGSFARGEETEKSDVDIAIILKNKKDSSEIEERFLNDISIKFYDYFKVHLDTYIKTRGEFRLKLKKNLPPVSTLIKSYSVIYGKEPLEI